MTTYAESKDRFARNFKYNANKALEQFKKVPPLSKTLAVSLEEDTRNSYTELYGLWDKCESLAVADDKKADFMTEYYDLRIKVCEAYGVYLEKIEQIKEEQAKTTAAQGSNDKFAGILTALADQKFDITNQVHKFDGNNVLDYAGWRNKVDNAIRKMRSLKKSDSAILEEIKNCLEGNAKVLFDNVPNNNANLAIVLDTLDDLFGNKLVSIDQAVDRLFDIQKMDDNIESLFKGCASMRSTYMMIKNLVPNPEDLNMYIIIAILKKKLSPNAAQQWDFIIEKSEDGLQNLKIDDFFQASNIALKKAQRSGWTAANIAAESKITQSRCFEAKSPIQERFSVPPPPPYATVTESVPKVFSSMNSGGRPQKNCIFCKEPHDSVKNGTDCIVLGTMLENEPKNVMKIVFENRACTNCFMKGHFANQCNFDVCSVETERGRCNRSHPGLMHKYLSS